MSWKLPVPLELISPEAVTLPPIITFLLALKFPDAVTLPLTFNFVRFPNDVMFGCVAWVVAVLGAKPAIVATVAACPVKVLPWNNEALILSAYIDFQYFVGEPKSNVNVGVGKIDPDVSIPSNMLVEAEV